MGFHIDDLPSLEIENQYSIFGGFKEPPVASLRVFQCPLRLIVCCLGELLLRDVHHRALDERQVALLIAGCRHVLDHPDRASILPSKAQLRVDQTPFPLQILEKPVALLGREIELLCRAAEHLFPGGISQHPRECSVAAKHSTVGSGAVETCHVMVKQELVAAIGIGGCRVERCAPQSQLSRYRVGAISKRLVSPLMFRNIDIHRTHSLLRVLKRGDAAQCHWE